MIGKTAVWALLAAATLAWPAGAAQYNIIDAPGAKNFTLALDINATSAATGWYLDKNDHYHGFFRSADGHYDTFAIDGNETEGNSLNDKGTIAGGYFPPDVGFLFGFLRTPGGKLKPFDPQPSNSVFIGAINNAGQIAGTYWDSGVSPHGYLRARDGTLTTFDAPGSDATEANAISDNGSIAGNYFDPTNTAHGFVRAADGNFAVFDAEGAGQGGSAGTYVVGINDKGAAAGYLKTTSFASHAFVRDPDGTITEFDAPGAGQGSNQGTRSFDINAHGVIAGSYVTGGGQTHGFLRARNGKIKTFDAPQASFTQPLSINADGVIAGYFKDSKGTHGFLRTP